MANVNDYEFGVAVSRELGSFGAVYVEPMWVNNSNPESTELGGENDSTLLIDATRPRMWSGV